MCKHKPLQSRGSSGNKKREIHCKTGGESSLHLHGSSGPCPTTDGLTEDINCESYCYDSWKVGFILQQYHNLTNTRGHTVTASKHKVKSPFCSIKKICRADSGFVYILIPQVTHHHCWSNLHFPLDVSLHAFFLGRTHMHIAVHTYSHMQCAHGVVNMTSPVTPHMCSRLLWERRKASASLCLSHTFLGKWTKLAAQGEKTNIHLSKNDSHLCKCIFYILIFIIYFWLM